jgi:hypothetical protein
MKTFGWRTRLKFALLAGLTAWLTGWLICLPFEVAVARRYVDGNASLMPETLTKGLVVWAGFSLFIAIVGFVPGVLPLFLLFPPRWIVLWRRVLIPLAPLAAELAIYDRMGLLHIYRFQHPAEMKAFFFGAANFFVMTFALIVVWVYVILARRRLESGAG